MSDDRLAFPLAVCRTHTGRMTHLGLDSILNPGAIPGEPAVTLCGRKATPLPRTADPYEGIADVECSRCLTQSFSNPLAIKLRPWPSRRGALALREARHRLRDSEAALERIRAIERRSR